MKLLLDSHALLWGIDSSERLPRATRSVLLDPANVTFVSVASVWELHLKANNNKLDMPSNLTELITESGFRTLAITFEHIERLRLLPLHHRDPFDRMLVVQAQVEGLTLVTADRNMRLYDVPVLWS